MSHPFRVLFVLLIACLWVSRIAVAEPDTVVAEAETAVAESEGSLVLHVAGLQDVTGNIFIAIYDSKDSWLSEDTVLLEKVSIADALQDELVQTTLQLPPGQYALTVFYDRDDDGELDTNFIGMPKEPIALSNNAKAKFGPPKFVDAQFEVGEEAVLQLINMEQL